MEFYLYIFVHKPTTDGFNSQRDGILRYVGSFVKSTLLFQFPTGWNSTDEILCCSPGSARVSIPNGMEFYVTEFSSSYRLRAGFNSQRDGILQRALLCSLVNLSFNSQRDGILLKSSIFFNLSILPFQFPTGWNSTIFIWVALTILNVSIPNGMEFYIFAYSFYKLSLDGVSIPNGMEFYEQRCLICFVKSSFNSQRDGILQFVYPLQKMQGKFQFPTGWNSTKTNDFGRGYVR